MKIFLIYFKNIIFFLQIKLFFQNEINSRILTINNCLKYDSNECIKCKEGYELINKHCYRINCAVFGFCKYCDDYDCLKCQKGYKLNYGICDKKVLSKKSSFLFQIFSFEYYKFFKIIFQFFFICEIIILRDIHIKIKIIQKFEF